MKVNKNRKEKKGIELLDASDLITEKSHPDLIREVSKKLEEQDLSMILTRLQEIEKALYHVAGRQKELLEKQEQLESSVVNISTTLEEILHTFEGAEAEFINASSDEAEMMSEDEAMFPTPAKKVSSLN